MAQKYLPSYRKWLDYEVSVSIVDLLTLGRCYSFTLTLFVNASVHLHRSVFLLFPLDIAEV